jgi:hypothetical protein
MRRFAAIPGKLRKSTCGCSAAVAVVFPHTPYALRAALGAERGRMPSGTG